jgi:hypothetical protein
MDPVKPRVAIPAANPPDNATDKTHLPCQSAADRVCLLRALDMIINPASIIDHWVSQDPLVKNTYLTLFLHDHPSTAHLTVEKPFEASVRLNGVLYIYHILFSYTDDNAIILFGQLFQPDEASHLRL